MQLTVMMARPTKTMAVMVTTIVMNLKKGEMMESSYNGMKTIFFRNLWRAQERKSIWTVDASKAGGLTPRTDRFSSDLMVLLGAVYLII